MTGIQKQLEILEQFTTFEERLSLIFLHEELKPGSLLMGVGHEQRKILEEFTDSLDLEMIISEGGERSLPNRLLGRDKRKIRDTAFIARNDERFGLLEQEVPGFAGYTDESVGRFLGYPESALTYYSGSEVPGADFSEVLEETDLPREELRYLNFVSYVPRPEEEDIVEAVEQGRKRCEELEKRSDTIPIYMDYRRKALEQEVI